MLAVAGWTIVAREAFAAIVGYVAYGLLLSLVWVRLFAVDVALTEAAIGSGVTGVLLISAAARLRRTEAPAAAERPGVAAAHRWRRALRPSSRPRSPPSCCCCRIPAPTLRPEAAQHLAETGLGNPVTAVLIAYRAFDTMLEKVVLLLAVVGVWSLARRPLLGRRAGPRRARSGRKARSPSSRSCCRRSASWSASISSGSAPTSRAAPSRAAPFSPPCG